ncbi:MAG: thioredoxin family protein [Gammaproteobacteria bacterium]
MTSAIGESIEALEPFQALLQDEPAVLAYFGGDNCNVCKLLRPKVFGLMAERFPAIRSVYVDAELSRELAAQYGVFTIPSVIAFFDGKETLRKARNFSMGELENGLARPYSLFFD